MNSSYRVRIEYGIRERPKVWVEEPKLRRRKPEERIPHTFADDCPCLFHSDFRSDLPLATTIVPWLCYWLFFYESWLVVIQEKAIGPPDGPHTGCTAAAAFVQCRPRLGKRPHRATPTLAIWFASNRRWRGSTLAAMDQAELRGPARIARMRGRWNHAGAKSRAAAAARCVCPSFP